MPPEPCGLDVGWPLCGNRKVSLQHVLSGCKVALAQGCFRCCHDQFLVKLAEVLESYRVAANHTAAKPFTSGFVKCGSMLQLPAQKKEHHAHTSKEWQMLIDLSKQLVFPRKITTTDIIMWSIVEKRVLPH